MNIFLLWFSIFSFVVFTLSVFPVLLRLRKRNGLKIDRIYLFLMLNWGIWLILFSFLYFSDVFVRPLTPLTKTAFGVLRTVVTILMLILYPNLLKEFSGRRFSRRINYLILIAPVVYIMLIVPILAGVTVSTARVINTAYYSYFTILSAISLFFSAAASKKRKIYMIFIRMMLIYHAAGLVISLLPAEKLSVETNIMLTVLPRAVFSFFWGVFELAVYMVREYRREIEGDTAVPSVFLEDFGITAREKDIIGSIASGLSNKESAGKFFISERTVETHIYSIYRKCNVKNKVELLNLISGYR